MNQKTSYYKTRDWIRKEYPHAYVYLYTIGKLEYYIRTITKSLNAFNFTNVNVWKGILSAFNNYDTYNYSFKEYHNKFIRDSLVYRINWEEPVLYKILKKRKALDKFIDNFIEKHINYLQLDIKFMLKCRLILVHPYGAFNPVHTPEGKEYWCKIFNELNKYYDQ